MYFDIYVNDEHIAVVGPSDLEHVLISVATYEGETSIFANGMSGEKPGKVFYSWLQQDLKPTDTVRIEPSKATEASAPRQTRKLRRGESASEGDKFCDFCKGAEEEVGRVIQAGDTPYICKKCVELCAEIFKGWEEESVQG